MQNLNNFLNELQNWYNAKYNGATKLPKIGEIAARNGFEYVDGRYLVVDGEKIRLDKLCKQNEIECNYKTGVKRTVENGTRVSRSKKTSFNFNGEKHAVVNLNNETTETVNNWLINTCSATTNNRQHGGIPEQQYTTKGFRPQRQYGFHASAIPIPVQSDPQNQHAYYPDMIIRLNTNNLSDLLKVLL